MYTCYLSLQIHPCIFNDDVCSAGIDQNIQLHTPTLKFIVLDVLPSVLTNAKSYSVGIARQFTQPCECCFIL